MIPVYEGEAEAVEALASEGVPILEAIAETAGSGRAWSLDGLARLRTIVSADELAAANRVLDNFEMNDAVNAISEALAHGHDPERIHETFEEEMAGSGAICSQSSGCSAPSRSKCACRIGAAPSAGVCVTRRMAGEAIRIFRISALKGTGLVGSNTPLLLTNATSDAYLTGLQIQARVQDPRSAVRPQRDVVLIDGKSAPRKASWDPPTRRASQGRGGCAEDPGGDPRGIEREGFDAVVTNKDFLPLVRPRPAGRRRGPGNPIGEGSPRPCGS